MARRKQYIGIGTFPFEKLPAELRVMIYEFYFETGDTINIQRRRATTGDCKGKSKKRPWKVRGYKQVEVKSRTPQAAPTWKAKAYLPRNGTALLQVSKQTLREALPVLYGKNKFTCFVQGVFRMFIKDSPGSLAHITDLMATCKILGPAMKSIVEALARDRTRLVRIRFYWHIPHYACRSGAEHVGRDIKRWVANTIHDIQEHPVMLFRFFEKVEFEIQFTHTDGEFGDCGNGCLSMDEAARAERNQRFIAVARRALTLYRDERVESHGWEGSEGRLSTSKPGSGPERNGSCKPMS
ncbi:hypothetical protein LTR86_000611 [Recurvomyces mirabilis]|nr:hypothetical protein LTR86_000611 [Recurvomyces mirabilis]